jgi:hypothetical protein
MSPNLAGFQSMQCDGRCLIHRICGYSCLISHRSLSSGTNEVVVLGMPFQPASDERAERTNVEASRPRVVERISCDLRAHPLTLVPLGYLGVKKNDGVGCELVLRYTGERAVNPGLEARVCRIVDDRHTHGAHCAREARGRRRGMKVWVSWLVDSDRAWREPAAFPPLLELGEQLTRRSSEALASLLGGC